MQRVAVGESGRVLSPGALVLSGKFRVVRHMSQGGMGEVYLSEQVSTGRQVALKMLRPELYLQPGMGDRFRREARLLATVDHPGVVRVVEFGESQEGPFLVMELASGETLQQALTAGPLPPARALPILAQVAEALAAIHAQGIVHRDLKPDNVVLTPKPRGERARLLDFGIAKLAEPDGSRALSQIGTVLGTPEYLSPEQATGAALDARSDIYSFGVLAFRTLSGALPFVGPSPRQFMSQHVSAAPIPLSQAAPKLVCYPGLCEVVMQCLEKNPAHRPQSARTLEAALLQMPRTPTGDWAEIEPVHDTGRFGAVRAGEIDGSRQAEPDSADADDASWSEEHSGERWGGHSKRHSERDADDSDEREGDSRASRPAEPFVLGSSLSALESVNAEARRRRAVRLARRAAQESAPGQLEFFSGGSERNEDLPPELSPAERMAVDASLEAPEPMNAEARRERDARLARHTVDIPPADGFPAGRVESHQDQLAPALTSRSTTQRFAAIEPLETRAILERGDTGPSVWQEPPVAPSPPAARAQILTVMLTDIAAFTERTSRQTREENARMLLRHNRLLLPVIKDHGGRVMERRGDGLLVVFRSPTESVHCGMALQDRLWRHNRDLPEVEQIHVRVAIHLGEVLVARTGVVGEPVQIASAVEGVAGPGEVVFTEAVNLARNRAEFACEPHGQVRLPGRGEEINLYRCVPSSHGLPFGGRDLAKVHPVFRGVWAVRQLAARWSRWRAHGPRLDPRLRGLLAAAAVVLAIGAALLWNPFRGPRGLAKVQALIEQGHPEQALAALDRLPADTGALELRHRSLRAAALHRLARHDEELSAARTLPRVPGQPVEPLLLFGLLEDYAKDENGAVRRALMAVSREQVAAVRAIAQEPPSWRQWGALRFLEQTQGAEGLNLVALYSQALGQDDCRMRALAARRLGDLGDSSATEPLTRLRELPKSALEGEKGCGQDEAAQALKQIKRRGR